MNLTIDVSKEMFPPYITHLLALRWYFLLFFVIAAMVLGCYLYYKKHLKH